MENTIEQQDVIRQLDAVEAFVEKDYLLSLNKYPVLLPSDNINPDTCQLQLFKLSKLIYKRDDNIQHKLTSVISALQIFDGTIALILSGREDGIDLYLGTCSPLGSENRMMSKVLKGCFEGQFPGSLLSEIPVEHNKQLLNDLCFSDHLENEICISSINLVPSEKEDKKKVGLEEFIESMKGHLYTCFLLGSPVKPIEIEKRLRGYEELHSVISPFVKTSIANGYNEGITLTTGTTETVSASITDSLSKTSGKNTTHTEGTNSGFSMGGSLLLAFNIMQGSMKSDSEGFSSGTTDTKGRTSTNSQSVSESKGVTNGTSHTLEIQGTEENIDQVILTIERGAYIRVENMDSRMIPVEPEERGFHTR